MNAEHIVYYTEMEVLVLIQRHIKPSKSVVMVVW